MEEAPGEKVTEQKRPDAVIFATNLRLALTLAFLGLFALGNFLLQNNQVNLAKNNIETIVFF